jgi:general L-amino acid transport system substrate-binding protein
MRRRTPRSLVPSVLLPAAMLLAAPVASAGILDDVKSRDQLHCGVSEGVAGFSNPDSAGNWAGLDVDVCRALAAAVLGDADKVRYFPLTSGQRILAAVGGQVDVTSRTTTWTMSRDAKDGADFTAVVFYDGQGFMVTRDSGIASATELDGATICVAAGTTTELNLADFARTHGITMESVVFEAKLEAYNAYQSGRCDAFTTDMAQLAGMRTQAGDPDAHVILPEVISKEPLSPLVRQGDAAWRDLVFWLIQGLIEAEERGITSENVAQVRAESQDPTVQRMLGVSGEFGSWVGLDNEWLVRAITQVGNYGEIFERHVGKGSPLGLDRGLNDLWTRGGLLYAHPIR